MKENSWNYFRIRIKHEGKKNTAGLCPADVYLPVCDFVWGN
jgi:hypothetical protein